MFATIDAVAAEFANERLRDFSVAVTTIGYPVRGLIGGFLIAGGTSIPLSTAFVGTCALGAAFAVRHGPRVVAQMELDTVRGPNGFPS